MPKNVMF